MHREIKKAFTILVGIHEGKGRLGRVALNGKIILEWIFKEIGCMCVVWIRLT
jgi:hypothetical protein